VLQSITIHNRCGGTLRRYAGVQVAEREDRSTSARQKNQATAEQFYQRYDEAMSLAVADALLEAVTQSRRWWTRGCCHWRRHKRKL
jgi:hypothetical protein